MGIPVTFPESHLEKTRSHQTSMGRPCNDRRQRRSGNNLTRSPSAPLRLNPSLSCNACCSGKQIDPTACLSDDPTRSCVTTFNDPKTPYVIAAFVNTSVPTSWRPSSQAQCKLSEYLKVRSLRDSPYSTETRIHGIGLQ